jgi:hypothetical protein
MMESILVDDSYAVTNVDTSGDLQAPQSLVTASTTQEQNPDASDSESESQNNTSAQSNLIGTLNFAPEYNSSTPDDSTRWDNIRSLVVHDNSEHVESFQSRLLKREDVIKRVDTMASLSPTRDR